MFPELRKPLLDLFTEAEPGSDWVITRYRGGATNLRTQFKRILEAAGIEPWPRLFQNLRASRATELAHQFPGYVAAEWLGHSEEIADEHYRQVLDSDFARAISEPTPSAARNPARLDSVSARNSKNDENQGARNHSDLPSDSDTHEDTQDCLMGAPGFEPGTKGL